MLRTACLFLTAAAALFAQDRSLDDLLKLPVPPATRRIAYGDNPLQFGELRVPAGQGPFPVVVLVHGGCWVAKLGKLDDRAVAMDLLRPIAASLAENGIATWNIEYRRIGNPGGGWPGTFEDVAHGTDYLRKIARENRLDLNRVVSMGHSAGGHLALWLAARPHLPASSALYVKDPLPLAGVVDLDGPGDLKALLPAQQKICGEPVVNELLGGAPEDQPQRYREASPIELLPLRVPQQFFAGRMFAADAPAYEQAAKQAGDAIQTTILAQAGHFVFVDPGSAVWPQILRKTKDLLKLNH